MKRTIFAAALATTAPALGHAQDMPRYDPIAWCDQVASSGAGASESIKEACIQQEQEAYDALKPEWPDIPAKTRDWCDKVAHAGAQGTYSILQACIAQEMESKKNNSKTEFKF